ncbi:MAG: PAS domain-containing protein, partial [Chloroflexi bacterium]|nr:PAS domain-containing protein [Chloroflexota bacterium]
MSLLEFTILVTRAVYLLLTLTTVVNFIREHTRARLLIMLLFLSFSLAIVIDLANEAIGESLPSSGLIRSLALIATPYLFLLLLKQSARVPVFVELFATVMFIISGLFIIYFGAANLPVWTILVIVGYLVIVYLYSASQFLRNAIRKRGVTRWRKGMAATGMILLALLFWLVGLDVAIGSGHDYFLVMSQTASIGSAISLYLAFATPRWLRRVWQQGEMFNFLQLQYQNIENRQTLETLHLLKHYAQQAVGAEGVYLFDYNPYRGQFNLRRTEELPAAIFPDSDSDTFSEAMERAVTASRPYAVRYLGEYKGIDARLAEHLAARDAYFVPIRTTDHLWGVMLLFLSNIPIFELDDLNLLAVMAEQSAQILENIHLLEEQADLIDKLREDTSNLGRSYEDERRRFFRLSNDLLVIVDFDGSPILLNPAWEKVTGYTREELMSTTFRDWVHPADLASVETIFSNLSQDAENVTSQNRIVCKDGSIRWFQWNSATLIGRKAVYAAGHDVTETKRAHETMFRLNTQLSQERARLENIMQSIPGLVWESWKEPDEEQDRIDFVSDHVEEMLGYTREEWLSTPNFWLQIIHPEDRARVKRLVAHQYQGEDVATTEFRWLTKDGKELWCLSQTTVITDEHGKNVALRGVTLDITKRHEAERKLEELYGKLEDERERLENIIRSVPGIVWESYGDPSSQEKQRFRYVSDYAETMLGYPVEQWINTPGFWQKILHPNDKAKAISVAAQRYQNGTNTVNEYRWIAADGKAVWCLSQATP